MYARSRIITVILGISLAKYSWAQCASVPAQYRSFFHHCVDNRTIPEKALNLVGLTSNDVGRSFALVAGVSHYPSFRAPDNPYLEPADVDLRNLEEYLKTEEFFDEIVVLKDSDMNFENLQYFLQVYFPEQLKKSPHSRFIFAYSGHGITDGASGYLLKSSAGGLGDKNNALDLSVVHALVQHVVRSGHQVLVLLNSCYGGAFLKNSFTIARPVPRKPGAHAITAGGSRERTWADPSLGKGSLFFETLIKGLGGPADSAGDGVITYDEIAAYLKKQIQGFTDQNQNPQSGSLVVDDDHVGSFFFLNRARMVSNGIVPKWNPNNSTPFGTDSPTELADAVKSIASMINGTHVSNVSVYKNPFALFVRGDVWLEDFSSEGCTVRWTSYFGRSESGILSALGEPSRRQKSSVSVRLDLLFYSQIQVTDHPEGIEIGPVAERLHPRIFHVLMRGSTGVVTIVPESGLPFEVAVPVESSTVGENLAKAFARAAKSCGAKDYSVTGSVPMNAPLVFRSPADILGPAPTDSEALQNWRECDTNSAIGCNRLATQYAIGDGGLPKDPVRAVALFKQACDGGSTVACSNLAANYDIGEGGLPKDPVRAVALYKQACDRGGATGCTGLAMHYENGEGGLPKDPVRAVALFKQACDGGSNEDTGVFGCYSLATHYENGDGVPKDLTRAATLFKKACDKGFKVACR
jgi:TPR repeat protein